MCADASRASQSSHRTTHELQKRGNQAPLAVHHDPSCKVLRVPGKVARQFLARDVQTRPLLPYHRQTWGAGDERGGTRCRPAQLRPRRAGARWWPLQADTRSGPIRTDKPHGRGGPRRDEDRRGSAWPRPSRTGERRIRSRCVSAHSLSRCGPSSDTGRPGPNRTCEQRGE